MSKVSFALRLDPEEMAFYKAEASREGISLNEWIGNCLREVRKPKVMGFRPPEPSQPMEESQKPVTQPAVKLVTNSDRPVTPAISSPPAQKSPYCKDCTRKGVRRECAGCWKKHLASQGKTE